MITAVEAKKQMLTVNQLADKQMTYIENRIKRAINENKKSATIGLYNDKDLVNAIMCELLFLGYHVDGEYSFEHHGWYINIRW